MPDDQIGVRTIHTEFQFHNGLSSAQRQRSAQSLQAAILRNNPDASPLEVSSFSDNPCGVAASAFNLCISLADGTRIPVETAFQAGKVFEKGGPYEDLLTAEPKAAKTDPRLKSSGKIIGFVFQGRIFPTTPVTLFYTWLYLHALSENQALADQLINYNVFTDIVFNPQKSINCQAYCCALYVSLRKAGMVERALNDFDFLVGLLNRSASSRQAGVVQEMALQERGHSESKKGGTGSRKTGSEKGKEKKKVVSRFKKGAGIEHPKYGTGTVKKITGTEGAVYLIIKFDGLKEEKQLSESWVIDHCKY